MYDFGSIGQVLFMLQHCKNFWSEKIWKSVNESNNFHSCKHISFTNGEKEFPILVRIGPGIKSADEKKSFLSVGELQWFPLKITGSSEPLSL